MNALTEYDTIASVIVKHVRDAFIDAQTIAAQWKRLSYTAPPDLARAIDQHDRFIAILQSAGATVHELPRDSQTTLDSIYVRDASIVSPAGSILCAMGKAERATEPPAQERAFDALGFSIAGRITPPGTLEGGDLIWLDDRTLAVGRGLQRSVRNAR